MIDQVKYKPIRQAARLVGKSRAFIKRLIDDGHIAAIRDGGTDDAPRLRVDPAEVEAAMRRVMVYIPQAQRQDKRIKRRTARHPDHRQLHPQAAAM